MKPDFKAAREAAEAMAPPPDAWSPPQVLPPFWEIRSVGPDGAAYCERAPSLRAARQRDGAAGLHARDEVPVTGQRYTVTITDEEGIHTGRRRYRVDCERCGAELHEGSTGPMWWIERHEEEGCQPGIAIDDRVAIAYGFVPPEVLAENERLRAQLEEAVSLLNDTADDLRAAAARFAP